MHSLRRRCKQLNLSGSCVSSCPAGTFVLGPAGTPGAQCLACNEQCSGCSGPGPSLCVSCQAVQWNGTCLATCPRGTYATTARTCDVCHPLCGGDCVGPDADQCVGSPANPSGCRFVKSGRFCVTSCATSEFIDEGRTCQPCVSSCLMCGGPSDSNCTVCAPGRFLDQGRCRPCDTQCQDAICAGPGPGNCSAGCRVSVFDQVCCLRACCARLVPPFFYALSCPLSLFSLSLSLSPSLSVHPSLFLPPPVLLPLCLSHHPTRITGTP
jgi:proprotein convertase subtilisin/kexin type 5